MEHVPLDRRNLGVVIGCGAVRAEVERRLVLPLELGHSVGGGN